jgi:hypothetical protein
MEPIWNPSLKENLPPNIKLLRFGTIWNPYGTLSNGITLLKKISYSDLEPYGTIWNPVQRNNLVEKSKLLRFGTIWNHMEPIWNPYGTLPRSKTQLQNLSY